MALAIFVPNMAGIYQPILKLYQTADHPALSPGFCHPEWRVKTADNSSGSGITTWKTTENTRHLSPQDGVGRLGRGLVWLIFSPVLTILHCSLK